MVARAESLCDWRRLVMYTNAPSEAKCLAIPRPIPLVPPVTTVTLSCSRLLMFEASSVWYAKPAAHKKAGGIFPSLGCARRLPLGRGDLKPGSQPTGPARPLRTTRILQAHQRSQTPSTTQEK